MQTLHVIDSHTEGESTRVVLDGMPNLGAGSLSLRCERLRREFGHWCTAVIGEPRGSDALVGAVLTPPVRPDCCTGVIFFDNAGTLGMCGHGIIGVVRSLAYLGRIVPGHHLIETPVGVVGIVLHDDFRVTISNVESWRYAHGAVVDVPHYGQVRGDIAWGGNWFFLTDDSPVPVEFTQIDALTSYTRAIRRTLDAKGITGAGGAMIDHVEVNVRLDDGTADARNYVLCPGLAYDRSPCGTGTSAKVACLAAAGKLAPGQVWRQMGILGSVFEATYKRASGGVLPSITGSAWITGESTLLLDPADPFVWGITGVDTCRRST